MGEGSHFKALILQRKLISLYETGQTFLGIYEFQSRSSHKEKNDNDNFSEGCVYLKQIIEWWETFKAFFKFSLFNILGGSYLAIINLN